MSTKRILRWGVMLCLLAALPGLTAALAQGEEPVAPVISDAPGLAPEAGCVPKAKEVALFLHENYGGQCVIKKIGRYPTAIAMGMPDDSITAIKVGSKARVQLFTGRDFGGTVASYTANVANLYYEPIGNDSVSSIKVDLRPLTGCKPKPNQVALFEHENFLGQCVLRDVGNYRNSIEIGLADNSISSVKVGAKLRLVLYRNDNFGGVSAIYLTNDNALYYDTIGNDSISSMRVDLRANAKGKCVPKPNQIALFEHEQYKGQCVIKEIGEYPDALAMGLPDNLITAVKVGADVKLVLYQDANFGGFSATYFTDIPNLIYEPIYNDTVSSVRVQSR